MGTCQNECYQKCLENDACLLKCQTNVFIFLPWLCLKTDNWVFACFVLIQICRLYITFTICPAPGINKTCILKIALYSFFSIELTYVLCYINFFLKRWSKKGCCRQSSFICDIWTFVTLLVAVNGTSKSTTSILLK